MAKRKYRRVIIDWKTGERLYPEVEEQLAAYAAALAEETGWRAEWGLAVNVSKRKPLFAVTTKRFKMGKRALNRFLGKLAKFEEGRCESRCQTGEGPSTSYDGQ